MRNLEPSPEHTWLHRLLGEWTVFDKDGTEVGSEVITKLGENWVLVHGRMHMSENEVGLSQMTLGFNPDTGKFTGTWIGSMMSHLWVYDGVLDESQNRLELHAVGPSFTDPTVSQNYVDELTIVDESTHTLTGRVQQANGTWHTFMTATSKRRTSA